MNQSDPKVIQIDRQNLNQFLKLIAKRQALTPDINWGDFNPQAIATENFFIYAVQHREELVGYVSVVFIPKPDGRIGTLYVDELWVLEEFRRRGLARCLMDEVIRLGYQLNAWELRLYVNETNQTARNFYQSIGMTETTHALYCVKSFRS